MWKEFKEFALKGNAVDLAIGVIIGAAFGGIVKSLVDDVLMPPIGKMMGGVDFSNMFLVLGDGTFPSLKAAKDAGIEKVRFAYSGETEPGKAYTYQVQGPTFVIQFLNIQNDGSGNPNNHIHSVWRRLPADFGLAGK